MREREFIEWIRRQSRLDAGRVPVGPGDDCAVVNFAGGQLLVTTDQVLDGVHFMLAEHGYRAAGRKALARNLSDVAAMAGVPVAAVATVALPGSAGRDDAEAIYAGLREVGDQFDCPLVGGDVGVWEASLAISVTVFARPGASGQPILRSGAKPGQAVCVTGRLGGAWRSRRHLDFTPRIAEAVTLAESCPPAAMIDISDGLSVDLAHICEASGVGAEITADAVPVHDDAAGLDAALHDGEDYELLFTLGPTDAARLCKDQPLAAGVTEIGRIVEGTDVTLIHSDGHRRKVTPDGWEHKTDGA